MTTFFKLLLITTVACIGLVLVGQVVLEHNSVQKITQALGQYPWALSLWRYGLYAGMLILWPYFVQFMGVRQKWPVEITQYLSHQRLKLFLFFVLVELLFVHNIVAYLFT